MRYCLILKLLLVSFLFYNNSPLQGATYTVTSNADDGSVGTFRYALLNATSGSDIINFNNGLGTIVIGSSATYSTALPYLQGVTINGGTGNTISGSATYPIFFAYTGTSAINNLTLMNGFGQGGQGGAGAAGGGGGLGAGGAVFICPGAAVNVSNLLITNNSVAGGNGGIGNASLAHNERRREQVH